MMGFIVAFVIFIQSREAIYDPPQFGFFDDVYNTINEHNERQSHYLSSFTNHSDVYF